MRVSPAVWRLSLACVAMVAGCTDSSAPPLPPEAPAPVEHHRGEEPHHSRGEPGSAGHSHAHSYRHHGNYSPSENGEEQPATAQMPAKVAKILAHIEREGRAPEGYEGGRKFSNFEGVLPARDRRGSVIEYREWDVNPHESGKNRGAERLVTGSDGSAYYTADHYRTFQKVR